MTMPRSRSSGPGAPIPTPMKSPARRACLGPGRRDDVIDHPPDPLDDAIGPLLGMRRLCSHADSRLPSSGMAPTTMLVPPRSTPTTYRCGAGRLCALLDEPLVELARDGVFFFEGMADNGERKATVSGSGNE